jgi:acyl-CoA dehydrogenase
MRDFADRAAAAAKIAAANADEVDKAARFPREAFAAIRSRRLLAIMLPSAEGGESATVGEIAEICYLLGGACASSAMIFAMHQIQVACLLRHGGDDTWYGELKQRIAREQLLFAGSTTDAAGGGDIRSSTSAVAASAGQLELSKEAAVMSYGAEADGILVVTRRSAEGPPSDQVAVMLVKSDYSLEKTAEWDALGMRGTCSASYQLRARGGSCQILPAPFAAVHQMTMLPIAHILWSSVWLGIAADALERARRHARASGAGKGTGTGSRTTRDIGSIMILRAAVARAIERYERASPQELLSFGFQAEMNLLKVSVSDGAVQATHAALRSCGLAGYRNDTEFSVGRHLRDVCSAPLMIGNDRILAGASASAALLDLNARLFK